jgi:hypothetical protein
VSLGIEIDKTARNLEKGIELMGLSNKLKSIIRKQTDLHEDVVLVL